MANIETKTILQVDTRQATASLRAYQQAINATKESMAGLTNEDLAYQQGLQDLKALQSEYNRIMRLSVQETKAAEGS